MCGIQITISNRNKLEHRGVSSNSIKFKNYHLIHNRLPIQTNLENVKEQPILLNDGSYLLYNGEIFNYPKGQFSSDVEYLKYMFNKFSIDKILDLANYWDGFWAIVKVSRTGEKYAFTDPLGKKQLYYNNRGEVASEIRPLVYDFKDFDPFFKSSVYKWGYNTTENTPWSHVKRIQPNRLYKFGSMSSMGRLEFVSHKDYYDWSHSQRISPSLKQLMHKAVSDRVVSKNYPIGVLVSGGLDSAIISSILTDLNLNVQYYTIENKESEYVEILSDYLGVSVEPLAYNSKDNLKSIFKWNETPIDLGSVIPQHELFKVIPQKVVISGDGADELFGGYRRTKEYDSQHSDIFEELTYYHLPRLDRASMRYTIELRNPFLSHDVIKYALRLPYKERINKKHLKDTFRRDLPDGIVNREKLALKNPRLVENKDEYKKEIFDIFYNQINFEE